MREAIMWLVMLVLSFLVLALVVELNEEFREVRQQAIDAGAAYWTVDEQTGVTEFKWRTCDE